MWIPARNIKLQHGSKRGTSQTNEDLVPGATLCSCRQSDTLATNRSSRQHTEDKEWKQNRTDNEQPRDDLGSDKEDSSVS